MMKQDMTVWVENLVDKYEKLFQYGHHFSHVQMVVVFRTRDLHVRLAAKLDKEDGRATLVASSPP